MPAFPMRLFRLLVCLLVSLGLECPVWVFAQNATQVPAVTYTQTGGTVTPNRLLSGVDSTFGRLIQQEVSGGVATGGVKIVDPVSVTIADAGPAAMQVARTMALALAAQMIARAVPQVATAAAIGSAAYSLFANQRCYKGSATTSGSLACDSGQAPTSGTATNTQMYAGYIACCGVRTSYFPTQAQAAVAMCAWEASNYGYTGSSVNGYTGTWYAGIFGSVSCHLTWSGSPTDMTSGQFFGQMQMYTPPSSCPAVIDALDPSLSNPNPPIGADGKCPTGRYTELSAQSAAALVGSTAPASGTNQSQKDAMANAAADALAKGATADLDPASVPATLSGPASKVGPTTTTTTTPTSGSPTTTTSTPTYNITYQGNTYNYTKVTNTSNVDGSTTTTTTTPTAQTCGLPGTPECAVKVDETGTPTAPPPNTAALDAVKAGDAANATAVLNQVQDPGFGFIGAPPIAACEPFGFPNNIGSINACGVVNDVRNVMAYLWALAGAWICFGIVGRTMRGGA